MRTNIEIDDELMSEAQQLSGLKTKKAVIEEALKMLVRIKQQRRVLDLAGKVKFWEEIERDRDDVNRDLGR